MGGKGQGQQGIHFADAADQGAKGSLPNGGGNLLGGDRQLGVSFLFFVVWNGGGVGFGFSGCFVLGVLVFLVVNVGIFLGGGEEGD